MLDFTLPFKLQFSTLICLSRSGSIIYIFGMLYSAQKSAMCMKGMTEQSRLESL